MLILCDLSEKSIGLQSLTPSQNRAVCPTKRLIPPSHQMQRKLAFWTITMSWIREVSGGKLRHRNPAPEPTKAA